MITVQVDYLSEREASAIRFAHDGFGYWEEDLCNMTYRFKDKAGWFAVDREIVLKFVDDWRRWGVWSLRGRDYEPAGGEA